jgi:hypothetical protein
VIEINLLSIIYLLLMVNLNHKPSKSVDVELLTNMEFICRIIDHIIHI